MAIVNTKDLLIEAARNKYAVGAFNITNLVSFKAVVEAAIDKRAPVIIQTSVKPAKFFGSNVLVAIYKELAGSAPIPIAIQLDHCTEVEYCKQCAKSGYNSIMIDASKFPFAENINKTKEVVDHCHKIGNISVEGELGTITGVEDQVRIAEDQSQLCNPDQAVDFVKQTGVDVFAPAIGTAHGVYKVKRPKVDFERLGKINQLLNSGGVKIPLVVHGGTGLPEDYISKLIEMGGSKFNVSTELKHALIDATFKYISSHQEEYDPGKVDIQVRDAIYSVVCHWMELLSSVDKA